MQDSLGCSMKPIMTKVESLSNAFNAIDSANYRLELIIDKIKNENHPAVDDTLKTPPWSLENILSNGAERIQTSLKRTNELIETLNSLLF